jgi:hypothetical protein
VTLLRLEFIVELRVLYGVWSQESEHNAISVTTIQVQTGPAGLSRS